MEKKLHKRLAIQKELEKILLAKDEDNKEGKVKPLRRR